MAGESRFSALRPHPDPSHPKEPIKRKEQHMRIIRNTAIFTSLVLGGLLLTPRARASTDELTKMTFNEPVEIPGKVLLPGTYEFRIMDNAGMADLNTVEILGPNGMHAIEIVQTISVERLQPTGKTVVTFEKRVPDAPQAIKDWFYPGRTHGVEFIYPNH
jgi:hypothetical protein